MTRRAAVVVMAGGVLAAGVAGTVGTAVLARNAAGPSLPAVDSGQGIPAAYRITYEVDASGSRTTEDLVVERPFRSHLVVTDSAGSVVSERASDVGVLITRSRGAAAIALSVPIAPSAGDQRLDALAGGLLDAARWQDPGTSREVGGRACGVLVELDAALDVRIERCVDELGLLLDEHWIAADGSTVLRRRAVELSLAPPAFVLPDAAPLGPEQGDGAVRRDDAAAVPFVEAFALDPPVGFVAAGRYVVVPPTLGIDDASGALGGLATTGTGGPGVAIVTDAWTRGPDLLLLDQGATRGGPPPFDPALTVGEAWVPSLGQVELAVGTRLGEVRSTRADGGFVRLAGTLPLSELLALARAIDRPEEDP